jgi:SAM-dependent methyltransferase
MAATWFLRLYRRSIRYAQADSFLTRRFIARGASISSPGGVDLCLDVGAGNMPYRKQISRHFGVRHYLSLDFTSGSSVDVIADARTLPIRDQSIDLVVCFEVLQHIAQYHLALDEVIRVLRPGGRVLFSFPFMYGECDVVDFRRWTVAGMAIELEDRGFTVFSVERHGGILFSVISFTIWAIQQAIPGSRTAWRSPRTVAAYCREALLMLLTFPLVLLGWPAIAADSLLPKSGYYRSALIFAGLSASKMEVMRM